MLLQIIAVIILICIVVLLFLEPLGRRSGEFRVSKMVVSVIFNRYDAVEEGTILSDIVYAKGQFTPASILYRTTSTEQNYEAVDYVVKNGSVLPPYVRFLEPIII